MKNRLNKKIVIFFISFFCFSPNIYSQTITIGTKNTSLIYKVDRNHQLQQSWFGAKFDVANEGDSLNDKSLIPW